MSPAGCSQRSITLLDQVFGGKEGEVLGDAMPQMETGQRSASSQKEPRLMLEEGSKHFQLQSIQTAQTQSSVAGARR